MATGRTVLLLALLTGGAALGGVACGNASLSVFNPTTPTPPCYSRNPPNCTFSGDVVGVFTQPDPNNPATQCFEGGCHSGSSPASLLALGPPNAVPPSSVWFLLTTSGGGEQRGGGGKDLMISSTAATAAQSLILLKPDADQPGTTHTGCKCFHEGNPQYDTILSWITSGAKNN